MKRPRKNPSSGRRYNIKIITELTHGGGGGFSFAGRNPPHLKSEILCQCCVCLMSSNVVGCLSSDVEFLLDFRICSWKSIKKAVRSESYEPLLCVTWETYLCFKANCRSFLESLWDSLEQEERTIENLMMTSQMPSFVDLVQLYRMFKHPFLSKHPVQPYLMFLIC